MHSIDVSTATFAREVLEASKTVPVVVDFWAPWCGPCRALKPILEKLVAEYGGRFRLAKINTDENPDVAAQYGVRGIPNVKAFVDGKLANEFTGALPESAVRKFVDTLVPSASEELRRAASVDARSGDVAAAEAKLRQAVAGDAHNHAAHADLAELLVARREYAAAEAAIDAIPAELRDDRAQALAAKIAFARKGENLPDLAALKARVDAQPQELNARLAYAERLAVEGEYQAALDQLLEVVRGDRGERREQARKAAVAVFNLAADQPDLVSDYRRRLSAALF
jgi:putative thioredoxin